MGYELKLSRRQQISLKNDVTAFYFGR